MTEVAAVRRRNRRVYAAKNDPEIYKLLAAYQFMTAEQMALKTGRDLKTIQKRLQMLFEAAYLNRARRDQIFPYAYFLDEKGAQEAAHLGYLPSPRFIRSKSSLLVTHDLAITEFHLALEKALHVGHTLSWEQWRGDLKDQVETPEENAALIHDARFTIDGDESFGLEIVRSYESEYDNGESNLVRKVRLITHYHDRPDKVLFLMPTKERVARFLAKIEEDYPKTYLWFTDTESWKNNILGKIWWSSADFRTRTYSLFK